MISENLREAITLFLKQQSEWYEFWVILRNITGSTGEEAKNKASEIAKIYIEGVQYLSSETERGGEIMSRPATIKALIELGRVMQGKESLDELIKLSSEAGMNGLNALASYFRENPEALKRNGSLIQVALKDLGVSEEEELKEEK